MLPKESSTSLEWIIALNTEHSWEFLLSIQRGGVQRDQHAEVLHVPLDVEALLKLLAKLAWEFELHRNDLGDVTLHGVAHGVAANLVHAMKSMGPGKQALPYSRA